MIIAIIIIFIWLRVVARQYTQSLYRFHTHFTLFSLLFSVLFRLPLPLSEIVSHNQYVSLTLNLLSLSLSASISLLLALFL